MKFTFEVFIQRIWLTPVNAIQLLLLNVNIRLEINLLYSLFNLVHQCLKEVLLILTVKLLLLVLQMPKVTSIDAQLLHGAITGVDRVVEPCLGVNVHAGNLVWSVFAVLQDRRLLLRIDLTFVEICTSFGLTQLRLAAGLVDHGGLRLSENNLLHSIVYVVTAKTGLICQLTLVLLLAR